MDKYERRRLRLLSLRDDQCRGSGAELARRIGRDHSYVTRMFYPEGKRGKKRIADDMMEVIEKAFSLSRGWLDIEPIDDRAQDANVTALETATAEDPSIAVVIAMMRSTDHIGRQVALGAVRVALAGYQPAHQANGAQ